MVIIIKERATLEQVEEMLQILKVYIKIAVDIEKGILAGGGQQHSSELSISLRETVRIVSQLQKLVSVFKTDD